MQSHFFSSQNWSLSFVEIKSIDFSEYVAPVVSVQKPNRKAHILVNFKMSSKQTSVVQHLLPNVYKLMKILQNSQHFTNINPADAYLQIKLDKRGIHFVVFALNQFS